MKTDTELKEVTKALNAYKRSRTIFQPKVYKKIIAHASLGRSFVPLHAISKASATKLSKVGFKVLPGENKPPHSIKYVIYWPHMFN